MVEALLTVISEPEGLFLIAVIGVAMFVRAAIGFGDAIIAVTVLSLVLSPAEIVPVLVLMGTIISSVIMLKNRESVEWGSIKRTVLPALVGIVPGGMLLRWGDETLVIPLLAVVVIVFAAYSLWGKNDLVLKSKGWSYLFGFFAGFLGGAYNFRGIVFTIYGSLRGWSPQTFRSTIHTFYLVTGFFVPIVHFATGLITVEVIARIIVCLPAAIVGSMVGDRFASRIDAESFKRLIWIALIGLAVALLVTNLP